MTSLTAEQRLMVARVVYSGKRFFHDKHRQKIVEDEDEDCVYFNPSLTGTDRERAQALDCIVAAFKSLTKPIDPENWGTFSYDPGGLHICRFETYNPIGEIIADDILTASLLAILETTCKQMS